MNRCLIQVDRLRGGWFGFAGSETPGSYTYQRDYLDLLIQYNRAPSAATWASNSPADNGQYHQLNYELSVNASDPDGDALQYWFRVATGPDAETDVVADSGSWQDSSRGTIALPGYL